MEITDINERIASVFKSEEVESKRRMLSALGSNLIWNDQELKIYNDIAIEKLIEGVKQAKLIDPKFEPKNHVVDKGLKEKTDEFSPAFSTLPAGWRTFELFKTKTAWGSLRSRTGRWLLVLDTHRNIRVEPSFVRIDVFATMPGLVAVDLFHSGDRFHELEARVVLALDVCVGEGVIRQFQHVLHGQDIVAHLDDTARTVLHR